MRQIYFTTLFAVTKNGSRFYFTSEDTYDIVDLNGKNTQKTCKQEGVL